MKLLFHFQPIQSNLIQGQTTISHRITLNQVHLVVFVVHLLFLNHANLDWDLHACIKYDHQQLLSKEGSQSINRNLSIFSYYISFCTHHKSHTFYWCFNIHDFLSVGKIILDILFYKPIKVLSFQYSVYLCQHSLL